MKFTARSNSLVPAGLLALSIVPVVAGIVRLNGLAGGVAVTPDNARFFAAPLPVVLHILAVIPFCILGAFQFAPGFRRRRRGWHRTAGKFLAPCGLVAAFSGLWMTQFYAPPDADRSPLLYAFRIFFGSAMAVAIVLAVVAVRRRDFARHGAWMMRGYAIGQGAGTQVLTHLPWFILIGKPAGLSRALLMGAGWIINVVVAEWIIRRQKTRAVPPLAGIYAPADIDRTMRVVTES